MRQYSHQTAYALQEAGMLKKYFTSIWYKPHQFPYSMIAFFPKSLGQRIQFELKKRYFEPLDPALVAQIPIYELLGQTIKIFSKKKYGKLIYWINRHFDEKVKQLIRNIEFDIFIGYESSSLLCFQRAKKRGKVTILDLAIVHHQAKQRIFSDFEGRHEGKNNRQEDEINSLKDKELELADYILVGSEFVKQSLLEVNIPEGKIIKIPYGFEEKIFTPKQIYQRSNPFKILYAGSITRRKGVQYLLQAFKELNLKPAELILIGGMGEDGEEILSAYRNFYKYLPFLNQEDLAKYHHASDIFVFPTLLEGFAQTVLEAMACGTPVITTPHAGFNEIVSDHFNGFLVPTMNVGELKEKIRFFYDNRDQIEMMGRNARKVAENYSWKQYRERIRKFLGKIADPQLF